MKMETVTSHMKHMSHKTVTSAMKTVTSAINVVTSPMKTVASPMKTETVAVFSHLML